MAHAIYQTAKAAPGYETPPVAAEAVPDFNKAVAEQTGEAHARMHALAVDHMRARGNSYAQAYSHVYGAPENETLRNKVKAEHLAATLRGVGDTELAAEVPAVSRSSDYRNPHTPRVGSPRAGSGGRP